ncbi:MAG: lysophospholipid acyltransferase family protein [Chitinophagales bacterium]
MNFIRNTFQFFWTIYFGIIFFTMVLVAFIVFKIQYFLFKDKYESEYKDFLFRGVGKGVRFFGLIFVKDIYHAKYDKNQSYVVVGNHNTAVDIPLNTSSCPKEINIKFLGKAEAGKTPFLGVLVTHLTVLVDRKNPQSRKNTFNLMAKEIAKGYSIFLYPEGTRNRTNEPLKNFYDGAFRLAIEHQLPIVVCTLVGTKKVNSPNRLMSFMPGKVTAHWEEPILTKRKTKDEVAELKEKVALLMKKRLAEGVH